MSNEDMIRFRHMLDAAVEVIKLSEGKSRADIENERLLNLSLVRLIEVVGEAANRISTECRREYSAIPWGQIIGMRNRLIHGYDSIDFEILYKTVTEDLPFLITELKKIL